MSPLRKPPTPAQLATSFPRYHLLPTQPLYRIHRATRAPWWFSPGTRFRFDLPDPEGSCYLAEEGLGAFVEAFQDFIEPGVPIPMSEVLARRQSELFAPSALVLADCTAPDALAFGITAEIHASGDRESTQAWAAAFAAAGFAGVRSFVRHDPGQRQIGIALFGPAGEAAWPVGSTDPIKAGLIRDVERTFGVLVR